MARPTRTELGLLAGIAAVALGLRLLAVDARLSDAEGYSWLVASAGDASTFLHRLAAYENTPPLFYLLSSIFPLDHEWQLRVWAVLPSVLAVPVTYALVRPRLGARAALLAGGVLAVAPYHISYADYSRAFMLAGLGVLLALWAAARLLDGGRRRWWWLWASGATLALWSEYDAALMLGAIALALLALGNAPLRRDVARFAWLPALTLLPWIGQFEHAQDALDHSKIAPTFPNPSLTGVRENVVRLAFGEHGAAAGAGARWLQSALVVGGLAALVTLARRHAGGHERPAARRLLDLLVASALLTLVLHAIASFAGTHIFDQRYFTTLIPVAAALAGAGLAALSWRAAAPAAALALALVATAVAHQRTGREYEADLRPLAAAVRGAHVSTVLTNSAVVSFYLRAEHPILDRPFGLLDRRVTRPCGRGCAIVEDSRAPGGLRGAPAPETRRAFGPFFLTTGG